MFREVQKFRQLWLWIFLTLSLAVLVGIFGYGLIRQLVYGRPWGSQPAPDAVLVILGGLVILLDVFLLWFFAAARLITEVRTAGLYVRFFPFPGREFPYRNIRRLEVRTYRPLREYGGWGIRYSMKGRGKAYTVSGRKGLQMELADGRSVLIGSRNPEGLRRAIRDTGGVS